MCKCLLIFVMYSGGENGGEFVKFDIIYNI